MILAFLRYTGSQEANHNILLLSASHLSRPTNEKNQLVHACIYRIICPLKIDNDEKNISLIFKCGLTNFAQPTETRYTHYVISFKQDSKENGRKFDFPRITCQLLAPRMTE